MANEFVTFNPYDEQLEKLRRRQRMADMLQQQAMQPLESQTAPGGYVVPTSPLLGLAKMLQAYSAGKTQRGIDTELADIRSRMGEEQRTREAAIQSAERGIRERMFAPQDTGASPAQTAAPDYDHQFGGTPPPPKSITLGAGQSESGERNQQLAAMLAAGKPVGTDLEEIIPTAQYRYDPRGAMQMAMTPEGAAAMQRNPLMAFYLAQSMKPQEAEEYLAPVVSSTGEYVRPGRRGGMQETGIYAPEKDKVSEAVTPTHIMRNGKEVVVDARTGRMIGEAPTKTLAGAGESVAQTAVDKRKYRETRLQLQNAYDSLGEFARELQNTPKGASLVGEAAGRLSSKYKLALGAVRTLQNTGVLNPGELPFIEDTLRNPQSISQLLNPASRDAISGQIDAIANLLEKQSSRNDESIGYDLAPLKDSDWRKKAASATTNFGAPPPGAVRRKTP